MPYLTKEDKVLVDNGAPIKTAGQLNYAITELIQEYLEVNGISYQTLNDAIGAMEGAKLEFYRRIVAPYEDAKARSNGDVYAESVRQMAKKLKEK